MRIVHLATTDTRGGASRGSFWLHQTLRDVGVDSIMVVGRKYSDDDHVVQLGGPTGVVGEHVRGRLDSLPLHFYQKTDESYWTVGWMPRRLGRRIAQFKPDLVHLHWTGGGFASVGSLREIRSPLVWTLRDMWAFTGGCHYTAGCMRFANGCGQCPQLRSERSDDLSRAIWRQKFSAWYRRLDLNIVAISRWLAECAELSPLFADVPVAVIPNGVDGRRFRPIPKKRARAAWNLDPNKRYILYGAIGALRDERKGFCELAVAVEHLAASNWNVRPELIVFGDATAEQSPALGLDTRFVGHIDDDERLAHLYASADVMVVPSLQEAFGKTLIEAMACGTPVVAFDHGGPADIVVHRETGYLARPFDAKDLAQGIAWCLARADRPEKLGRQARGRVEKLYELRVVAQRYRELYGTILERLQ